MCYLLLQSSFLLHRTRLLSKHCSYPGIRSSLRPSHQDNYRIGTPDTDTRKCIHGSYQQSGSIPYQYDDHFHTLLTFPQYHLMKNSYPQGNLPQCSMDCSPDDLHPAESYRVHCAHHKLRQESPIEKPVFSLFSDSKNEAEQENLQTPGYWMQNPLHR